ncbi:nucleoid-associated protein [Lysinibacillus xylanilyticus]|uniref:nucleoid-associated protein n=1 Tax=Lysinibacillus xylanilyticus TaxID=582475 RepID=UPI003D951701
MIEIQKLIVHNLNLSGRNPIFSDSLIDFSEIDEIDEVLEFFKKHIETTRFQGHTKQCKFNNNISNNLKSYVTDIYDKFLEAGDTEEFETHFIDNSRLIADHLARSMRGKSPSDGSVFILLYSMDNIPYIGILKMDPNTGIQIREDLKLDVHPHMLPSIKEKLHKSAFIKFTNDFQSQEVDLFALDKQQSKDEPAKYFMSGFLEAIEKANSENMTKIIEKEAKIEICALIENPIEKSRFSQKLKQKLITGEEFNLDDDLPLLAREFFEHGFNFDESISSIKRNVRAKYPDAIFEIVPAVEKVKELEFKSVDKSVTIKIDANLTNEMYTYYTDEDTGETIFRFDPILEIV